MPYEFFFSYSRSNNDNYLKRLFKDLNEHVRLKLGRPAGELVGFLDQQEIELGQQWDAAILNALQTCKVMVAVASPGYFKSPYCGKEWELFRRRCVAHAATGDMPPLLKHIVWIEFAIDELPADVRALQLLSGDPHAVHNVKGVRYLLQQLGKQRAAYVDFIHKLGDEIIAAGRQYRIPPLQTVPELLAMPPAFPLSPGLPDADAGIAPMPPPSGPKHVHFIFVAASPASFGGAREDAAYVECGAGDWKPFYPTDGRPVNPLLQQVAARNDLLFSSAEIPLDDSLLERVDAAWTKRQIIVIVVDPWSLHWDAGQTRPVYQNLLRQLDSRLDYHWCVLVPWNMNDPVCSADRDAILQTVRSTFDRHSTLSPNPMFYRDGIASADDLQATLAEVLTRLKEEINKRATVQRPVPVGSKRPMVNAASVASRAS